MRDIREDLRDRIREVRAEEYRLQRQLEGLGEVREGLEGLLKAEERRWSADPSPKPAQSAVGSSHGTSTAIGVAGNLPVDRNLREIILDIMSDYDPWSGKMVTSAASKRGYVFGESSPGRVVHFTMIALANAGLVRNVGSGRWERIKPASQKLEEGELEKSL